MFYGVTCGHGGFCRGQEAQSVRSRDSRKMGPSRKRNTKPAGRGGAAGLDWSSLSSLHSRSLEGSQHTPVPEGNPTDANARRIVYCVGDCGKCGLA